MTEGEVRLDGAKTVEIQRRTQCGRNSAAKNPPFTWKRDPWLQNEARLAIIGAEFGSHMGSVGFMDGNGHGRLVLSILLVYWVSLCNFFLQVRNQATGGQELGRQNQRRSGNQNRNSGGELGLGRA